MTETRHVVRNYTRKHLPREEFVSILKELARTGTAVGMPEVLERAESGAPWPRRAFAITFDDGFRNNVAIAAPVLAEMQIPATFYVTTGFIGTSTGSWIDLIEFAVERTARVRLSLPALGLAGTWTTADEKRVLLDQVRRVVKHDPAIDPSAVVSDVWAQTGVSALDPDAQLDDKMTWRDLQSLADHSLFTVGGHSHTHRILEFLPTPVLTSEVATSVALLRDHLGAPIDHYSYPEGLAHCFSDRVIDVLKQHGIRCAPTAIAGTNSIGADPFRLSRVMVA
ncbi:MAG: polysaccharide deacetylase family protein [Vicinamibacterales bacterium]